MNVADDDERLEVGKPNPLEGVFLRQDRRHPVDDREHRLQRKHFFFLEVLKRAVHKCLVDNEVVLCHGARGG